ncbi:AAA domain-containing protein [Cellulosimicrobium cellulans]|uniref:AAA domain-containing protein n=1 Tax=Cellulosimicrobium cellulans TaxID=1710 RepID=UPI003C6250C9
MNQGSAEAHYGVVDQSSRLLDYLSAVAREVGPEPVRDVRRHEITLWPADVPPHRAVLLGPTQERTTWLQVRRVPAPDPVDLPEKLERLIDPDSVREPDREPALRPEAVEAWVRSQVPDVVTTHSGEPGDEEGPAVVSERRAALRVEIDEAFTAWRATTWEAWVVRSTPDFAARALYGELYALHLRAESEQDQHEVVWGHAVISYRGAGTTVVAPVLTAPVVIEMDPDDGSIRVTPERTVELELDALEGTGLSGFEDLVGLRSKVRELPPDPWSSDEIGAVRRSLIAPLGLDATLTESADPAPAGADPVLNAGWVLMLRKRPLRQERFYDELASKLRESERVPDALASVVADKDLVDQALRAMGHNVDVDDGTARRLLMPLPTNDDQERIARQLARSRGVTVQGPPGTGKSHTIVNLLSHLVAQGKRVLVTAQNDQALRVLRDKIPQQLRDLSIAVLGSTPAAMEDLRSSAQSMQDSLSSIDDRREEQRIVELGKKIDQVRENLRRTDLDLVEALRSEQREYALPMGSARAPQVAEWVGSRRGSDVVSDRVPARSRLPLTTNEVVELQDLARSVDKDDADHAARDLPVGDWLPSTAVLRQTFDRIDELQTTVTSLESGGLRVEAVDRLSRDDLQAIAAAAMQEAQALGSLAGHWEAGLANATVESHPAVAYTVEHNEAVRAKLAEARALKSQVAGQEIEVPDGDPHVQLPLLQQWSQRLAAGKKIPVVGARGLKALSDQVRVGGYPVRTAQQVDLVAWAVRLRTVLIEVRRLMVNAYQPFGIPVPDQGPAFQFEAEQVAQRVQSVHRWWHETYPALSGRLVPLVTVARPAGSVESLQHAATLISAAASRLEERELNAQLDELARRLVERSSQSDASGLWATLGSAVATRDPGTWDQARAEVDRLLAIRPRVQRRTQLAGRLADGGAPVWARAILESGGDPGVVGDPHDAGTAWAVAAARSWLSELHGESDVARLMERAHEEAADLRLLIVDLASRSARLRLKQNTKDRQRKALGTWLEATRRAGKGTGKNAPRFLAQARAALPEAMGSVPVWIMPIYRVLENFDPRVSEPFDVVIVDESSQCDLLSLGVLALGEKSVVVGDDKQTSPQAVGIRTDRIFDLQGQFIPDLHDKSLLTMDESLYSISSRAFPSTILLREHFRCVPEIITFSNRYYNGKVLPLREITVPQIGDPLRAVHVTDGASVRVGSHRTNRREAEALVDQVAECAADSRYDGLTFGVVTMMSGPQAQIIESMLVERLGAEEYERRQLRVGNPPVFQGDERHVVFISVVADDNSFAATRTMHEQWANVAASRAQDQLWVFYSVDPSTLNHNDQRRQLIEYVRDAGHREDPTDLYELTESKFERDVLAQMLDRGYAVEPQHRVGAYRIDFVVTVGEGERLAVECDGDSFHGPDKWDEDVRRQRVLERLGWSFWRVRASAYYLDPEASMQPLWDRLEAMKQRAAESAERRQAQDAKIAAARLVQLEREAELAAQALVTAPDVVAAGEPDAASPSNLGDESTATPSAAPVRKAQKADTHRAESTSAPAAADVRRWARAKGIPVGDRGRLAPEVTRAFLDAQRAKTPDDQVTTDDESRPGSEPAPWDTTTATDGPPTQAEIEGAWNTGRRYQLDSHGAVYPRGGSTDLVSAIGREAARPVVELMRRARPQGGTFKIGPTGILVTYVGAAPIFVSRVPPENWFPNHL